MPRKTTEFSYAGKSVRITVPLASDEHIAKAALEFEQLAHELSVIKNQKGRVSERVWSAQNKVYRVAWRLKQNVLTTKHYKKIR